MIQAAVLNGEHCPDCKQHFRFGRRIHVDHIPVIHKGNETVESAPDLCEVQPSHASRPPRTDPDPLVA